MRAILLLSALGLFPTIAHGQLFDLNELDPLRKERVSQRDALVEAEAAIGDRADAVLRRAWALTALYHAEADVRALEGNSGYRTTLERKWQSMLKELEAAPESNAKTASVAAANAALAQIQMDRLDRPFGFDEKQQKALAAYIARVDTPRQTRIDNLAAEMRAHLASFRAGATDCLGAIDALEARQIEEMERYGLRKELKDDPLLAPRPANDDERRAARRKLLLELRKKHRDEWDKLTAVIEAAEDKPGSAKSLGILACKALQTRVDFDMAQEPFEDVFWGLPEDEIEPRKAECQRLSAACVKVYEDIITTGAEGVGKKDTTALQWYRAAQHAHIAWFCYREYLPVEQWIAVTDKNTTAVRAVAESLAANDKADKMDAAVARAFLAATELEGKAARFRQKDIAESEAKQNR